MCLVLWMLSSFCYSTCLFGFPLMGTFIDCERGLLLEVVEEFLQLIIILYMEFCGVCTDFFLTLFPVEVLIGADEVFYFAACLN